MSEKKLLIQPEQAVNQITVAEKSTSRLQTTVDAMKKLGAMRIEIPDSLKKKAKGVVLASTLAVSGAFMLGNPDKAFAQTQGDAPKVEQGQNVEMFNSNELPDGSQALKDFRAYRTSHPEINAIMEKNVKAGNGPVIPADMIPQVFRNAIVKTQTEQNPQPSRVIEQPTQPVQAPQSPRGGDFPTIPIIAGIGLLGFGLRKGNQELNKFKEKIAKEKSPRSKQGERPDYKIAERINEVKKGLKNQPTLEQFIDAVKVEFEGKPTINIAEFLKVKAQGGVEVGLSDKILLPAKFLFNKYNENWLVKDFEAPKTMDIEDYLDNAEVTTYEALLGNNPAEFAEAMKIIQDKFYSIKNNYGLSEMYQSVPLTAGNIRDEAAIKTKLQPIINSTDSNVVKIVNDMLKKIIDA
jgi:hypothetical protein